MRKIGLLSLLIVIIVVICLSFTMKGEKDQQQSQNEVQEEEQVSADVQAEKGLLDGYTIVLDAGHGGKDGGAVGVNGTIEKDITYPPAEPNKQELQKYDATRQFTRKGDRVVELADRVRTEYAELYIRSHYDGFESE